MTHALSDKNIDKLFPEFLALDLEFEDQLKSLNLKHLKALEKLIKAHDFGKIVEACYPLALENIIEDSRYERNEGFGEIDVYKSIMYDLYNMRDCDGNEQIRDSFQDLYKQN